MMESFGHEKLMVYQKGMRFVALRGALLDQLTRRVAAMLTVLSQAVTRKCHT